MRRVLNTVYEYLALWFGLGLLGLMCLLWSPVSFILLHLMPRRAGGEFGRYMNMFWFRHYLWMLAVSGSCKFDLSGLDALRGKAPVIIAPNHPSLLDALMVISRLPNIACIMKTELRNNIFMRGGARFAQYIDNASMRGMIRSSAEALMRGNHVLLFPEGSRTVRPPVNAFSQLTGLIARSAQVPVQTVFIESTSGFLGKGWPLFRKPSMPITYRIRLGRQFAPQDDVRAFTTELEQYFSTELATSTVMRGNESAASARPAAVEANLANRT
ncbi:MAG: lysophospholipid acyltransferase family protein [Betaproteobacteria bacterium]